MDFPGPSVLRAEFQTLQEANNLVPLAEVGGHCLFWFVVYLCCRGVACILVALFGRIVGVLNGLGWFGGGGGSCVEQPSENSLIVGELFYICSWVLLSDVSVLF